MASQELLVNLDGERVPMEVYESLPWGPLTLIKARVVGTRHAMLATAILRGEELLWVSYEALPVLPDFRAPRMLAGSD